MSLALTKRIWERRDLRPATKLVALALADRCAQRRAEPDCYQCWPGIEGLAAQCGVDCRTVYRALRDLRDRGLLHVLQRGRKSSLYCLVPLAYAGKAPPAVCEHCKRAPEDAPCRVVALTNMQGYAPKSDVALTNMHSSPDKLSGLLGSKTSASATGTGTCDKAAQAHPLKEPVRTKPSFSRVQDSTLKEEARASPGRKECFEETARNGHDPPAAQAREALRKRGHLAVPTGVYVPVAVRRLLEGTNGQIPPTTRLAFEGQLWDCAAQHGLEPLQRALRKLAVCLPSRPGAIARYFQPILRESVTAWRVEKAQEHEWEENRRATEARQKELWDQSPERRKVAERFLRRMRERLHVESASSNDKSTSKTSYEAPEAGLQ